MSTNLTTNVPAHIAARIAARKNDGTKSAVASAIVSEGSSFPRISTRSSRYRLVEDGVETPVGITLDVIIVGANPRVSKVFFNKAYDANATDMRPACFSNDGIRPDPSVESPCNAQCADCPNNALGSKVLPSGAKSKLCADQRHLAVVPAADPSKVYALTIPVSGMKALREYFKELANYGIAPEEAITELGFDDQASYPKIVFKHKGYVPEKAIASVDRLTQTDDVKVAVRLMAPQDAQLSIGGPSAPAPKQVASSKPAPAPAVDEAYEEEEEMAASTVVEDKPLEVKPVKASDELSAKLDSLFDE